MPNGYNQSITEWERMEKPLLQIDAFLADFASQHGLQLEKNYHNWPQRELKWVRDGLHRTIHIVAADKPGTYHFAIVGWQDKKNQRYVAHKWVKKWVSWVEIQNNLQELLRESISTLESWSESDLRPA
jgi:hypothetical protein